MKKLIKIILITIIIFLCMPVSMVSAEGELPNGYSEWSTKSTGDPNEISATQYGRKLPKTWSEWSTIKPDSPYYKEGEQETRFYAYDGETNIWNDAKAKTLFTWDFKKKATLTFFYADVDNYVSGSYTNYSAPPLKLYCDDKLIAKVGNHDYLENWDPDVNCECRIVTLKMSDNNTEGRDRTCMVGTWATTTAKTYSYVVTWKSGSGWRFDKPYKELFGEDSQIPVTRQVYSHPITYKINYDFDGGEAVGDVITTYTVLDEVELPLAVKTGYEFSGWYEGKTLIERIEKGTFRDIDLLAKYKRKKPSIFAGYTYFDEENKRIPVKELISMANVTAEDELDGDITKNVTVSYIIYEKSDTRIDDPSYLDVSERQAVTICFKVTNSGGKSASIKKKYYILGKGEELEKSEDVMIYSRYIDGDRRYTLGDASIWNNEDYKEVLEEAYQRAGKD